MAAFKSPFEKLSYEAQDSMAKSVNPGGALYNLIDKLVAATEATVTGGAVAGGKMSKEALAAIEGLALASKRMAGAIAIIAAAKPKDVEKFFGVFIQLKKTFIEELTEEDSQEMLTRSLVLGKLADVIVGFGHSMSAFAAMSPIILFGALAFFVTMRIIKLAMAGDFLSNVFGVFIEDQIHVIAEGIMKLGLALVAFAALSPVILIGAMAFWLSMVIIKQGLNVLGASSGAAPLSWFSREVLGKKSNLVLAIDNVRRVSYSILTFGILMSIATPFLVVAFVGALIFYPTIVMLTRAFKILGDKRRRRTWVGAIITAGLILATMLILLPAMVILGAIGAISPLIILGSLALGLSVIVLSFAFKMAGKGAKDIALGALAFLVVGFALIAISIGVYTFSQAIKGLDSPWEFLAQLGVTIVGLGLAMAAAGAGPVPLMIAAGAAAMLLAGAAIVVIADGLLTMSEVFEGNAWKKMIAPSGETGFFGGEISNLEKLMTAVGYSFMWDPIRAASIGIGAAAMLVAGNALVTIGKGIQKFQGLDINYDVFPVQMDKLLNTLADSFAKIGKEHGGAGLFGLGGGAVYQGIQSVMGMGNALSSIAYGMSKMAKLQFPTYNPDGSIKEIITLDGAAMTAITTNVAMMVETLSGAFANIGKKYGKGEQSLWEAIKSMGTKDPVAAGISMVQGLGGALGGIASAMKDMSTLKFNVYGDPNNPTKVTKVIDLTKGNALKKVGENIMNLVKVLVDGFANVGKSYKDWRSQGDAARGLDIAQDMGPVLGTIVEGMKTFNENAKDAPKQINNFLREFAVSLSDLAKVDGNRVENVADGIEELFEAFEDEEDGIDVMIRFGKEQAAISNLTSFFKCIGAIPTHINKTAKAIKLIADSTKIMDKYDDLGDIEDLIEEASDFEANGVGDAMKKIAAAVEQMGQANYTGFPYMGTFLEKISELDLSNAKTDLESIAESYVKIAEASQNFNIEAIEASTDMFKALAYLSEQGGEEAIEALGGDLIEAVEKLALMIADFGGTVDTARANQQGFISRAADAVGNAVDSVLGTGSPSPTASSGGSVTTVDNKALIAEIKRLQAILVSGDAVVQVESNIL